MKLQTPAWVALTFLMLFLVVIAAGVFLLQGRATLLDRTQTQALELTTQAEALADARLTESQQAQALADAQAQAAARAADAAAAATESAELAAELAALRAVPTATPPPPTVPTVVIAAPEDGARIPISTTVSLVVTASDPIGIAALNITRNGDALGEYDPADAPVVTIIEEMELTVEETITFAVTAINTEGRAAEPVAITVEVFDAEAFNAALRARIEANVAKLRGLEPLEPIVPTLLTPAELRVRFEADFAEDYSVEEAADDVLVYFAFDLLGRDFPLYDFLIDLYSGSVGGFYDPDTAEFVVVSGDSELDELEQWTHAHEFMHALQDQHFGLDRIGDDTLDSEARAALRALAEGEAEWLQLQYILQGYFNETELRALLDLATTQDTSLLEAAPDILRNDLAFPYEAGSAFVEALYEVGGWEAINDAWAKLPRSTEHILHPDRYRAGDVPQLVALAPLTGTLGADWELLDEDILGEFYLREYLSRQLGSGAVDRAATGWGGDRYAVYLSRPADALVMVLRSVWDSEGDSAEFLAAYTDYATARYAADGVTQPDDATCWTGADVTCLWSLGPAETLIVRAPDADLAAVIAAAVGN